MKSPIGYYEEDCLICVECWNGYTGERAFSEDLPDGFTCAECGEVVGV